jgi:RNA polymerase sigma-70 factor, ECF subfamily
MTYSQIARIGAAAVDGDETLQMDEEAFRLFYERTARPLWAYLSRITGDPRAADDLLQEAYYRLLRSRAAHESDEHRKHSLFRIATNLARDAHRRARIAPIDAGGGDAAWDRQDPRTAGDCATRAARRIDLSRAMDRLKPRERALLWLAYAHGSSHVEIARTLGLTAGSVKQLLFRARRRLARLLGEGDR